MVPIGLDLGYVGIMENRMETIIIGVTLADFTRLGPRVFRVQQHLGRPLQRNSRRCNTIR